MVTKKQTNKQKNSKETKMKNNLQIVLLYIQTSLTQAPLLVISIPQYHPGVDLCQCVIKLIHFKEVKHMLYHIGIDGRNQGLSITKYPNSLPLVIY